MALRHTADLTGSASVIVAVLYAVVASVPVWAPVVLYFGACQRARASLNGSRGVAARDQRLFAAVPLLVFGKVLAAGGLVRLF